MSAITLMTSPERTSLIVYGADIFNCSPQFGYHFKVDAVGIECGNKAQDGVQTDFCRLKTLEEAAEFSGVGIRCFVQRS